PQSAIRNRLPFESVSLLRMQRINLSGPQVQKKGCHVVQDVLYLPKYCSTNVSRPSLVRQIRMGQRKMDENMLVYTLQRDRR
ncbi:MAG: hypothetical protein KAQ78_07755, partial [Candidatus Latescibacteria bacterium]|nr:hypothetical protein [Candidatus Latescibacterota bacterium]